METFFVEYYDRLAEQVQQLKAAFNGLPVAALDWVPGPEMNSITVLVMHTAGSVRYWVGDAAGGEASGRVRAAEFKAAGLDDAALAARLDEVLAHSQRVLDRMAPDELDLVRGKRDDGQPFTGAWALLHALEHAAQHVGHVQLTRQLWDQQKSAG